MKDISKLKEYVEKGYIKKKLFKWEVSNDAPKEVQDLLYKIENQYNYKKQKVNNHY